MHMVPVSIGLSTKEITDFAPPEVLGEVKLHCIQVAALSSELGRLMGWSAREIGQIEWAGYLHDFGKYLIPADILTKTGKLDTQEWETIQRHPHLGAQRYLETAARSGYRHDDTVYRCILEHHERWDGSGYPFCLKGDEISLPAQIVSLADVVQALMAKRCYRGPFSFDSVVDLVEKERGAAWSKRVSDLFLTNLSLMGKTLKQTGK